MKKLITFILGIMLSMQIFAQTTDYYLENLQTTDTYNNGIVLVPLNTNNYFNHFQSASINTPVGQKPILRVSKAIAQVSDPYRFLSFPLKNAGFTDWKTAPIVSVVDHSKTASAASDNNYIVQAWSGLTASGPFASASVCRTFESGITSISSIPHPVGGSIPYVGPASCSYGKTLSYDGHNGVDYGVDYGTAVYAAAKGVVTTCLDATFCPASSSKNGASYGRVILKHVLSNGKVFYTWYMHLSKSVNSSGVQLKVGDIVNVGDKIGESGNTSPVPVGSHLHFEVRIGGTGVTDGAPVDPFGWSGSGEDPLSYTNGYKYIYDMEGYKSRLLWK